MSPEANHPSQQCFPLEQVIQLQAEGPAFMCPGSIHKLREICSYSHKAASTEL